MRNETLKNLLLTASLISASAFLTACSDNSPSSSTGTTSGDQVAQAQQAAITAAAELTEAEAELAAAKASGDADAIAKAQEERDAAAEKARLAKESKENEEAAEAEKKLNAAAAEAEKQRQEADEQARRNEIQRLADLDAARKAGNPTTPEEVALKAKLDPLVTAFSTEYRSALDAVKRIENPEYVTLTRYKDFKDQAAILNELLRGKPAVDKNSIVASLQAKLDALAAALPNAPALGTETIESNFIKTLRADIQQRRLSLAFYNSQCAKYNNRLTELSDLRDQYELTSRTLETNVGNLLTAVSGDDLQKGVVSAVTAPNFVAEADREKVNTRGVKRLDTKLSDTVFFDSFNATLALPETKALVLAGKRVEVVNSLLKAINFQYPRNSQVVLAEADFGEEGFWTAAQVSQTETHYMYGNKSQLREIEKYKAKLVPIQLSPSIKTNGICLFEATKIEVTKDDRGNAWAVHFNNSDNPTYTVNQSDYVRVRLEAAADGAAVPDDAGMVVKPNRNNNYLTSPIMHAWADMYSDTAMTTLTDQGKAVAELIDAYLKNHPDFAPFWNDDAARAPASSALSAKTARGISESVSLRQARTAATGFANLAGFKMNGVAGQSVELGMPLFVQLKGDVSSAKATEATTGSVAYRLGNTVIGAIQGYANSGAGFEADSSQLETSVVASHSFGSFFIEGQIGSVSATEVHGSNWSGVRSQLTLGLDTAFVSPFVQLTHRQLDRSGLGLGETTAYVGLDMEVAKLAADTYSIDTRLLAKAGYGSKDWSAGSKALGSTTGFSGVVEWSASLNLNSGVAFSSNLALDTTAGSSAGLTVSLDR
jgi:hypothetical protein